MLLVAGEHLVAGAEVERGSTALTPSVVEPVSASSAGCAAEQAGDAAAQLVAASRTSASKNVRPPRPAVELPAQRASAAASTARRGTGPFVPAFR